MPENVALQFTPYHDAAARKNDVNYPTGERVYEANARFADAEKLGPYDILPALKSVQLTGGSCRIGQTFVIKAGKGLENEALLLKENLTRCPGYGTGNKGTKLSLQLSLVVKRTMRLIICLSPTRALYFPRLLLMAFIMPARVFWLF